MAVTTRPMKRDDAPGVADLARQLGYDVTGHEIAQRLQATRRLSGSVAFVAEGDGRIVGWVQAVDRVLLQEKRALEIGGLVVDANRRGEGIGALLVDAVGKWARGNDHTALFVRSNVVREGAHDFYPALGFVHQKTSHTYVMELE